MNTFNTIAAVSSIVGMIFSLIAAIQAQRASKAALAARDAALVRSLSDDLDLACKHGERIVDFLRHSRYKEACTQIDELTWRLSELPYRRGPHLSIDHKNTLLTSRQQIVTINEAIDKKSKTEDEIDNEQLITVARKVTMRLREVLGDIRSNIEHGEP
jgi:ATP phosphoribosyltransferase regulatory subunit HisZ